MQDDNNNNSLHKIGSKLLKSTQGFGKQLQNIFSKKQIDPKTLQKLQDTLLANDFGPKLTYQIISEIEKNNSNQEAQPKNILKNILIQKLQKNISKIPIPSENRKQPFVIIVMGVNGSGKTTSIGKIAHLYQSKKLKTLIAAGDTFRAAAIDQISIIAAKTGAQIYKKNPGFEPAALAFNAWQYANENNFQTLIIDTAGRLQNKTFLMDELEKIVRVINKLDEQAPHCKILVVDANTGQNMLSQVENFNQAAKQIDGIIMTKMDSSSKGGIIFSLCDKFDTKILALGTGEKLTDITKIIPQKFVEQILDKNT